MFDKWFYIHQGKMCGPVAADKLNELAETGGLDARDLIWRAEASPKDAVRAGQHLIFFLAGGQPTAPPVEEAPPLATPVAPVSPAPAPDWLSELEGVPDSSSAPSAAPLDWLSDVRNDDKNS